MPKIGWMGCRHMTRPVPPAPASLCTECRQPAPSMLLVCLSCPRESSTDVTVCRQCAFAHASNHPLLLLGITAQSESGMILGRGHVLWYTDDNDQVEDKHPGVACDACKGPMISLRYKNLCREDHDLCEDCFALLCELGTGAEDLTFQRQFNCQKSDVFAELKTSRGVEVSRDRNLANLAFGYDHDHHDEEEEEEESKEQAAPVVHDIPPGHTRFSWIAVSGDAMPMGHTAFSWGI